MDKIRKTLAPLYRWLYFPPAIIFAAIMVATFSGWQGAKASLAHDVQTAADSRVMAVEQSLREHMVSYEQILRGGVGIFQGSTEVTRADWENYLAAFDVNNNYSGVEGIGFIKTIRTEDIKAFQTYMVGQGIENFKVWPAKPQRSTYAAVMYIQQGDQNTGAFGFDMYSDPIRKASMLAARDTGSITITPSVNIVGFTSKRSPRGFNMFAPYYGNDPRSTIAERQLSLQGYVYAAFRATDFFQHSVGDKDNKTLGFDVTVKSGNEQQLLYISPNYHLVNERSNVVKTSQTINLYGQIWTLNFALDRSGLISEIQLRRPGTVLFFGTFSAILIAIIVVLLLRARSRDLNAQKELAVELAKDELLSLASHQLRTPATGVKQYVGMILQGFAGKVSKEQRELLERAYASNDRQLRIINEILHVAKIDAGHIVLAKQQTNLNDLINDVVREQQADIEAAEHTVEVTLPKHPLILEVDAHMLRMAIENVLSNAIKYTPGRGRIIVRAYREKLRVHIGITDTGVGINAADIHKIFHQFSRLPNEMSQQVGGTGVGLYLAKHLVELHGGRIKVTSKPKQGSTFTIVLPARRNPIKNFTSSPKG